jgi:type VII secretion protein EccB
LVAGEPDVPEPPMRRLTITTMAGLMIAILVAAGFAVVGLIRPGDSDSWHAAGTVIVEKETGARFILVDGTLHPVLNYSSAVLALGAQTATVQLVSRSALSSTPRGATIGIDGLPDSLPSASNLITAPWSVCSSDSVSTANVASVQVTLHGGDDQSSAPIDADHAVLVSSADASALYLLWHGQRLRLGSAAAAASLGLNTVPPLPVGTAFLNALPQGTDLSALAVPGVGGPGPAVGGSATLIGQLVSVSNGTKFYVVLADGLEAVSPVVAGLLRIQQIKGRLIDALAADDSAVLRVAQSTSWQPPQGLPSTAPTLAPAALDSGSVCVVDDGKSAQLILGVPPHAGAAAPRLSGAVTQSALSSAGQADQVVISPGRAALVKADTASASLYLVAAPGEKYPVTAAALKSFGYSAADAVALPQQLLLMMPSGAAMDPTAARREVVAGGGTGALLPAPSPS